MKRPIIYLGLVLCLSSCGIYQTYFDCPAGQGVGCKSVNEVLDMIVEKDQEQDVFVPDVDEAAFIREQDNIKKRRKSKPHPVAIDRDKKLVLRKERKGRCVLVEEER